LGFWPPLAPPPLLDPGSTLMESGLKDLKAAFLLTELIVHTAEVAD
jgi:hypothetical protein